MGSREPYAVIAGPSSKIENARTKQIPMLVDTLLKIKVNVFKSENGQRKCNPYGSLISV
jgi:hypothetical protein